MDQRIARRDLPDLVGKRPLEYVSNEEGARRLLIYNLEVNAVDHCNLTCRQCSHMAPIRPPGFLDPAEALEEMRRLATACRVNALCLLGGEPLLHPRLHDLIVACREAELCEYLYLTTNGTLVRSQPVALWRLLDFIVISVHHGGVSLAEARQLQQDLAPHVIVRIVTDEFRQLYLSRRLGGADARYVWRTCEQAHDLRCHFLHRGRYYVCPTQRFITDHLAEAAGRHLPDGGLDISRPHLFRRLERYLQAETGPAACHHCLGSAGAAIPDHATRGGHDWRLFECETDER